MEPVEQVVTGEAVALDLQLANAGSRGVAALIDYAIVIFALIVVFVIEFAVSFTNSDQADTVILVTDVLIVLGYPVAMETLWHGRTLGKAMMGLRVVRDDGGPIRFRHALVRGLMGIFVDKPGITYTLGAFIPIAFASRNKKRFGDMAAGTIVLMERVPGSLDARVSMPPPLAGWAAQLDLTGIDDGLALRLRHFVARATQLSPTARASLEYSLANEVVARIGPPPSGTPGWAILHAVLAERRRRAYLASQPQPSAPTYGVYPVPPSSEPATTSGESAAPPVTPPDSGFAPPG